ncbi:MAG TPA: hypothetical protein VIH05_00485 [Tepidiformaceae bacterium]
MTSDLEESGGGRQPIDWLSLSEEMGLITWYEEGRNESGGTREAREAIARILGDDEMRAAVDYYVSGAPGSELARSVLWLLHPVAAMDRCVEIFRSDADIEDRRSAVHLLEVAADTRTLELVPEFLADPDDVIPMWGIGIVDQLMIPISSTSRMCGLCSPWPRNIRTREYDTWPDRSSRPSARTTARVAISREMAAFALAGDEPHLQS